MKLIFDDGAELDLVQADFFEILYRAKEKSQDAENSFCKLAAHAEDYSNYTQANMFYKFADEEHKIKTLAETIYKFYR